ncbi:Hypothetical predicted protein [Paramuricea clavata]|uniref:Retrovirus-related Pol polyprotein from transposon TNT 1-94-like beta-barrel domain-containing protein n=1 Tax=Paramuricea clavata TaxID=317549 RepID=A0A7D9HNG9_PARCT|nr:Hypothetical predicted protein [Paramuricea clavata]
MKVITDQLATIKAPIPEDEHIVALLLSLPRSYNTLVTALTAKGDELNLSQRHQALLNEEEKCKQKKEKPQYQRNENQGKFEKSSKHNAAPAHGDTDKNDDSDAVFAVGLSVMKGDDYWIIDSGASQHMTSSCDLLMNYQEFLDPEPVVLGDGRSVHALGTGKISITMLLGPKEKDERKSTMT